MQKVRLTKLAWKPLTNKPASQSTLFRDLRSAGVFSFLLILLLGLAAGDTVQCRDCACPKFTIFWDITAYSVCHVFGKCCTGQLAEVKGFAVMVWDFSFEYECAEVKQLASAGHHIALHIKDTAPLHRLLDYPDSWVAHYRAQAYELRDPVVAWVLSEVGSLRWSAIRLPDPFDILGQARGHGVAYGATVSTGPLDARTTAEAIQRAASCDLI